MADILDENNVEKSTGTAKCPACAAEMEFDPEASSLTCPYCGCKTEIKYGNTAEEIDFSKIFVAVQDQWGGETHVFQCNNCGGKELFDKNEISKACPFCGTTNVVESNELTGIKPSSVVPFKISKEVATENSVKWAKKRFYAPRKFKKEVEAQEVMGSYSPAFTFDSQTNSFYNGRLGKTYHETHKRNGKTYTVTKVRWFRVSGSFNKFYDDVMIRASEKINQKYLDKLGNFDTNNAEKYNDIFLHGFSAQVSDRKGEDCWVDAKKIIDSDIRRCILKQYDYDRIDYLKISTNLSKQTFKYVLLPIYFGHYTFKKKLFNFYVNGHNGKVSGKTPISPLKVFLTALGVTIIAVLLIILFAMGD